MDLMKNIKRIIMLRRRAQREMTGRADLCVVILSSETCVSDDRMTGYWSVLATYLLQREVSFDEFFFFFFFLNNCTSKHVPCHRTDLYRRGSVLAFCCWCFLERLGLSVNGGGKLFQWAIS